MQLRDLLRLVLEKKFSDLPETQRPRALAQTIKVGEMDIRRAAGIEPGTRRNQEKAFQLTLKILPICKELGIDPNCTHPTAEEIIDNAIAARPDLSSGNDDTQGKKRAKKAGFGAVPARRNALHRRKTR